MKLCLNNVTVAMSHEFSYSNWHVKLSMRKKNNEIKMRKRNIHKMLASMRNEGERCCDWIYHQIVWPMKYFISIAIIVNSTDFSSSFNKNYIKEVALCSGLLLLLLIHWKFVVDVMAGIRFGFWFAKIQRNGYFQRL